MPPFRFVMPRGSHVVGHTPRDVGGDVLILPEGYEVRLIPPRPDVYVSTRSAESEDAHRDFDNFDVDDELLLLRMSLEEETPQWDFVRQAFQNIDEYLRRGGPLPTSWVSPQEAVVWHPPAGTFSGQDMEIPAHMAELSEVEVQRLLPGLERGLELGMAAVEEVPLERPTIWDHLTDDDSKKT